MELSNPEFWFGLLQIIFIDLILSGDNAVVIALACRNLPANQRTKGIIWGTVGAIVLRVILIAFAGNIGVFIDHILIIAVAVFLQDALALGLGYGIASSFRLSEYNRRAVTFEVGIRNAGLGLGIVFSFFDGLGGMALVAGWWGIWDIIAGLALASWWARRATARPPDGAPG